MTLDVMSISPFVSKANTGQIQGERGGGGEGYSGER